MRRLAVAGAGGHGRVVADLGELLGWDVAFYDDGLSPNTRVLNWRVVGPVSALLVEAGTFDGVIVGIGDNQRRLALSRALDGSGAPLQTLVHPSAVVSSYAAIGRGSVLMPHGVVMAGSTLGMATIINTAASVDHDCHLDDGVHVSPGARLCGAVEVGAKSWIGAGAVVIPGLNIGGGATVGAGSVVIRSVETNTTVAGNPAKPLGQK